MLSHERFIAYQRAIEFLAFAHELEATIPRRHRALAEQLRRAALSIPLNIAEGTGRSTGPDRAHFYRIARGSAMECGAILDACAVLGIRGEDALGAGKRLLTETVCILTRVCQRHQKSR